MPTTPPARTSSAVIHIARWKPATSSWFCGPATAAPTTAIPSRPATRATALFVPLAIPASCSPTSASTVAVSGATIIERPIEKTSSDGRSSDQYEKPGLQPDHADQRQPGDERADAHEPPRAVSHRQPADARREKKHHDGDGEEGQARSAGRCIPPVAAGTGRGRTSRSRARRTRSESPGSRTRSCGGRRGAAEASAVGRGSPRARTARRAPRRR